jgi:hypothetical protein
MVTDSFDSEKGAYHSSTATDRGSLCSDGPISIEGSVFVKGDARAGKGFKVTFEGNPTLTGSHGSRLKPLNFPTVDDSRARHSNDNSQIPMIQEGNSWRSPVDENGNLLLDGNKTIDLPPGIYHLNDVMLEGQAVLNITGPTTIYVTGDLRRAGGVQLNNHTRKAANLKIMMTGGTARVTSYDAFFGVIYAPNTDVTLDGNAEYFGTIVGKTLTVTGTAAGHYDESIALAEMGMPRRTALVD